MFTYAIVFFFIVIIMYVLIKDTRLFTKINIKNKKIGVIITTHGNNGILVEQCIKSHMIFLPKNTQYFLFVNESKDPVTLSLNKKYPNLEYIYIKDQHKNGGLTGTWNQGINKCLKKNCDLICISNDDLIIDSSIHYIIQIANHTSPNSLHYYGPVTNNPGPSTLNKGQSLRHINTGVKLYNTNLNGFFMVFFDF